ncbi:ATP-dependent DNA helicase [Companilactobacillus nantensis]|uniref:ATP-dependent helicase DinG n=1 Tax=Companilactobacillus nantensis DSM 16982 TaxID=1423774 RepID=A0A0R1WRP1_9LACO|nr:ATP-dependent DNA helicase [Companilactobacillus nantensis]KRM17830.1 ATP-dependent helicase DinG [Companilactobacillus nantensis DSM 16982]GEO63530.1 ATP-dependent helicase [Companilactobacillus nantensis]
MDFTKKIINLFEKDVANVYESSPRQSQVQMALDVEDFLVNSLKQIMFVEAPVGTGKTLGVLVPSLLYCSEFRHRITYATATKNLQSQIMNTEIPQLEKLHLVSARETVLAMGKSNYACLSQLKENEDSFLSSRYSEIYNAIVKSKTGSRDELEKAFSIHFSDNEWKKISLSEYVGRCSDYLCKGHGYRGEFNRRHTVTITNHDMIIQSYINEINQKGPIVPIMGGVMIIDEAHLFDENFLGRIQQKLSLRELQKFYEKLTVDGKVGFENIKKLFNNLYNQNYGKSGRHPITDKTQSDLRSILKNLQSLEITKEDKYDYSFSNALYNVTTSIGYILNKKDWTCWLSIDDGPCFNMIPNHFYDDLADAIKFFAKGNKVIFLSGTLTATDNPIGELENNWKLENFKYKLYNTPFNIYDQAYIYVPKGICDPKHKESHQRDVLHELDNICNNVSGGILLLNNSLEMMDSISSAIGKRFQGRKVLKQGEKSNEMLTSEFKRDKNSILLGSGSFFSGFSIPGNALQAVVITSLPFPVPDDPFVQLQQREFGVENKNKFVVLLNMMLKRLEQGIGRLIRQNSDYGIVCITDPRIYTHNYGELIRNWMSLNGYNIRNGSESMSPFQKQISGIVERQLDVDKKSYNKELLNIPNIVRKRQKNSSDKLRSTYKKNIGNDDIIDDLKKSANKRVREIRKEYPKAKITLTGFSKVNTIEDLAQVLVDSAFTSGIDRSEFVDILPMSKEKWDSIHPNSRLSGPVVVTKVDD